MAAAKTTRLEGIHYVRTSERTRTGTRKRRKPTLAELEHNLELLDATHRRSNAIRWTKRIPQVEPSFYAEALMVELAKRDAEEAAKPKRARKVAKPQAKRNGKVAKPAESIAGAHPASNGNGLGSPDVFRMYRRELAALGTPEATAELERRHAKREARQKVAA